LIFFSSRCSTRSHGKVCGDHVKSSPVHWPPKINPGAGSAVSDPATTLILLAWSSPQQVFDQSAELISAFLKASPQLLSLLLPKFMCTTFRRGFKSQESKIDQNDRKDQKGRKRQLAGSIQIGKPDVFSVQLTYCAAT
jgi:hypothetical protein